MPPLLLASASPRRRALLGDGGVGFETVDVTVAELTADSAPELPPAQLAEANAALKARAGARPGRWTLGADTVVALHQRVFGKPASLQEAREFLRALSGRVHLVITACALVGPEGRETIFHVTTRVAFRTFGEETITRYLAAVPVLDKAGAYGLQDHGEWLVEAVHGSSSNVIGLPMERLMPVLQELGLAR